MHNLMTERNRTYTQTRFGPNLRATMNSLDREATPIATAHRNLLKGLARWNP